MKKLFFILSLSTPLYGMCQDEHASVVKVKPVIGQGYLVLNRSEFPTLHHWETTIIQRTFTSDNEFSDHEVLRTTMERDINYQFVPAEYRISGESTKYIVHVTGLNSSGVNLVEEEQQISQGNGQDPNICQGCSPTQLGQTWTCNGFSAGLAIPPNTQSAYAWTLSQHTDNSGNANYDLEQALEYDPATSTATYFYQYMYQSTLDALCPVYGGGPGQQLFDLPNCHSSNANQGFEIIGPLNGNDIYFTVDGIPLNSGEPVYGIRKDLGPWRGPFLNTPMLGGASSIEQYDMPNVISMFNSNANFSVINDPDLIMPFLTCEGEEGEGGEGDPEGGGEEGDPCLLAFTGVLSGIYDEVVSADDCYTAMGEDELIDRVILTDLNTGNSGSTVLNPADFYDGAGKWVQSSMTLDPGLYSIGVVTTRGKYHPFVQEVHDRVTIKKDLADLLHVIISPVPFTGNEFQLNIKADATLRFTYHLVDFSGTEIHTQSIAMRKGDKTILTIHPGREIPTGLLFNRFVFEDGSVLVMETMKE